MIFKLTTGYSRQPAFRKGADALLLAARAAGSAYLAILSLNLIGNDLDLPVWGRAAAGLGAAVLFAVAVVSLLGVRDWFRNKR